MRILLATDGSPSSGVAVELVAGLDWPRGTSLRVASAIPTGTELFGGPWPALAYAEVEDIEAELRSTAHAAVEEARARIERPGLEVSTAVLAGRPATAIVDAARTTEADLVVVGSRGHGSIGSMLLGSVSAEVVDHSPVPVLVARRPNVGGVVVGWDGSDCGRRAMDLVRTWPMFGKAHVSVVSVADVGTPWWTGFPGAATPRLVPVYVEAAAASRRLHADLAKDGAAELVAAGLDASAEPREGDAASEIISAATARDAELIVVGTHGRTGLPRLLLGSVARNVLHHAHASVLIVRQPREAR